MQILQLLIYSALCSTILTWSTTFEGNITRGRQIDAILRSDCRVNTATSIAILEAMGWTFGVTDYVDTSGIKGPKGRTYKSSAGYEPFTQANAEQLIDLEHGYMIASYNRFVNSQMHWSEVAGAQWKYGATSPEQVSGLRQVRRESITNEIFRALAREVPGVFPVPITVKNPKPKRLDPGTDAYYAFLNSPNGRGVAYLIYGEPLLHHLAIDHLELTSYPNQFYDLDVYLAPK